MMSDQFPSETPEGQQPAGSPVAPEGAPMEPYGGTPAQPDAGAPMSADEPQRADAPQGDQPVESADTRGGVGPQSGQAPLDGGDVSDAQAEQEAAAADEESDEPSAPARDASNPGANVAEVNEDFAEGTTSSPQNPNPHTESAPQDPLSGNPL
jgi:hypothetical protein